MTPEKQAGVGSERKFEKQLRYLVTCLKHTSDGRTDWNALIAEQKIVNVPAAKKRFARILAPYGITERSLTGFGGPKARKEKNDDEDVGKKGSPKKKRKVADMEETEEKEDSVEVEVEVAEEKGEEGEEEEEEEVE